MGLITRCPVCGTMFKVVADQLKISEGWVRCGHCAEIFDAAADLHDEAELEIPPTAPAPVITPEMEDPAPHSGFSSSLHSEVGDSVVDASPEPYEVEEQVQVLREDP